MPCALCPHRLFQFLKSSDHEAECCGSLEQTNCVYAWFHLCNFRFPYIENITVCKSRANVGNKVNKWWAVHCVQYPSVSECCILGLQSFWNKLCLCVSTIIHYQVLHMGLFICCLPCFSFGHLRASGPRINVCVVFWSTVCVLQYSKNLLITFAICT